MRDRLKSERYFTEAIEKEAANCRLYEEAGAAAKICGIDDIDLRECAYYPYDFVYFQ